MPMHYAEFGIMHHHHRKDTRAAHAASAYGGESAGAGFPFQGGAAAFVPL